MLTNHWKKNEATTAIVELLSVALRYLKVQIIKPLNRHVLQFSRYTQKNKYAIILIKKEVLWLL